ncbi:hypothetical protein BDR03DRAFT_246430 [Suillus americanus]|nr:hypothetical protein BDR03DRAFT_246430 [Suillus americanus]
MLVYFTNGANSRCSLYSPALQSLIAKIGIVCGQAFNRFVFSQSLFVNNGALYTSVRILGATAMPQSILGFTYRNPRLAIQKFTYTGPHFFASRQGSSTGVTSVRKRLRYLGQALCQNCRPSLIVSSSRNSCNPICIAACGYGCESPASLFDMHALIKDTIGKASALISALALVCCIGQKDSWAARVSIHSTP